MARLGRWPGMQRHGLLSTRSLLDRFEVPGPLRSEILSVQRCSSLRIAHPVHGNAVIRDQKPLSAKKLASCLTDCDVASWFRTLNERVFFWLNFDRLITLMSAAEYIGKPHTVLYVDSAKIVSEYSEHLELAHMNTGNTRPFAHPRGRETFRKLHEYPYEQRRRLPDYSAIVELTVLQGVPNISNFVTRVEHAMIGAINKSNLSTSHRRNHFRRQDQCAMASHFPDFLARRRSARFSICSFCRFLRCDTKCPQY